LTTFSVLAGHVARTIMLIEQALNEALAYGGPQV